jgi:hypothetical protein
MEGLEAAVHSQVKRALISGMTESDFDRFCFMLTSMAGRVLSEQRISRNEVREFLTERKATI